MDGKCEVKQEAKMANKKLLIDNYPPTTQYHIMPYRYILRVQKMINAVHFSTFMLCHPWEYK